MEQMCYVCRTEEEELLAVDQWNVCKSCVELSKTHFLMVCLTCGNSGAIVADSANLFRLGGIGADPQHNIVNLNWCHNCYEVKDDLA